MRDRIARTNTEAYGNQRLSVGSESVARVVVTAVETARPRTRYLLTPAARAMVTARTLGGDRVWDRIVTRQFGL